MAGNTTVKVAQILMVVTVGLGATLVAVQRWGKSPPVAVDQPQGSDDIVRELRGLRAEVSDLRRQNVLLAVRQAEQPIAAAVAPAEKIEESPEAAAMRSEQSLRNTAEALDRRLVEEGVDRAWADDTANKIRTAVDARLPGAKVAALNCASNLCRITLTHENVSDLKMVGKELATLEPFNQGTFYRYDEESSPPKTILYVARAGQGFGELAQNR